MKDHDKGHFWVTVPSGRETIVLVCMVTKQAEKRKEYYRRKENFGAIPSLIAVPVGTFDFLPEPDTVVECNLTISLDFETFKEKVEWKSFSPKCRDNTIPADLKKRIIQGIKDSPVVSYADKALVKQSLSGSSSSC